MLGIYLCVRNNTQDVSGVDSTLVIRVIILMYNFCFIFDVTGSGRDRTQNLLDTNLYSNHSIQYSYRYYHF